MPVVNTPDDIVRDPRPSTPTPPPEGGDAGTQIVRIERFGSGADSVAHLADGTTLFVPLAAPGDTALVALDERKPRYARGHVVEILEPSAERVTPACPHFGTCGGCDRQHVSAGAQDHAKRQTLVDALARIGHLDNADGLVGDLVTTKHRFGYRNKIELTARRIGKRLALGYLERGSDRLVEIDRCELLPKRYAGAPRSLAGALRYALGEDDFGLERVALRVATNTGDVEIALYTIPGSFPRARVAKVLVDAIPGVTSVVRVLMKGDAASRKVSGVETLYGGGRWREKVGEFEYQVSAPSFFQVNTRVASKMVEQVIGALAPDEGELVLDLYAGAGTFTLPLADRGADVIAVESYGPAVRDLRANLDNAGLWADVVGGDAAREIERYAEATAGVVDPPRAGLAPEVVTSLIGAKLRTLVYVSCDPATLARDLALLSEGGYTLEHVTPYDMFPQTAHVETVAVLGRPNG